MINYVKHYGNSLDDKLASGVSNVVNNSFRHANKQMNTYTQEGLEAFLSHYKPENIRGLFLPPIVSVFAYDKRWYSNPKLVGNGFLGKGEYRDDGYIDNGVSAFLYGMYVDPKYQGQGIGTQILKGIIDEAKIKGIKTIQAFSTDFNGVLDIYLRHGFRKIREAELTFDGIPLKFHEIELDLTIN